MKVAIIGTTGHINYVLDGMRDQKDLELVGVAPGSSGEDIKKLNDKVKECGYSPQEFDDYSEMLDKVNPDVAAIACFFNDHARVAMEVIRRGIHVFCEKPLATTLEDLVRLEKVYSQSTVHLAAMFGIRYTPWFLTAWNAVNRGAVGEVRLMNAQKSYRLGERGDNFKKREMYGGTIPWVGSHAIDWLQWFSGEKFKAVSAYHSKRHNRDHGDLELTALCSFEFSNEVYGSVNIDYLRPAGAPTHGDDRIRVAGTRGVIEVRENRVFLINDEQSGILELELEPKQEIFIDFLAQIRGEKKCMVSARESFSVSEACLKARLAADENRSIKF